MISTVTTTTVTTIVTLTSGVSLGVIATFLLTSLLGTQEVLSVEKRHTLKALGRNLNVGVLPLLFVFTLAIFLKTIAIP
jgi:hypothetical protein